MFGHHPVREAIRSAGSRVSEIKFVGTRPTPEHRALIHEARLSGIEVESCSRDSMSRYTGAQRHDQGIAAKVRLARVTEVDAFVETSKGSAARDATRLVALDGVTNSQNVGMVVRSVVGAGLAGILWPLVDQPWVNGLVVRAAAGSIFECPIILCDSLTMGLASLQAAGFSCVGLDGGAEQSLFAYPPPHRAVFVLGSESTGLSEDVRGMLDETVSIPMVGPLESLNVAVAAGLVAFHAAGLSGAGDGRRGARLQSSRQY